MLHRVPQSPQLVSVVVGVSQPLMSLLSQLPQFALQAPTHVPESHVAVALGREHETPQAPQLVSVSKRCSQPSLGSLLQSSKPWLQEAIRHAPVEQVAVALLSAQAAPHAAQSVSVFVGVSQPLLLSPSQSAWPAAHPAPQFPFTQSPPQHCQLSEQAAASPRHPMQPPLSSQTSAPPQAMPAALGVMPAWPALHVPSWQSVELGRS